MKNKQHRKEISEKNRTYAANETSYFFLSNNRLRVCNAELLCELDDRFCLCTSPFPQRNRFNCSRSNCAMQTDRERWGQSTITWNLPARSHAIKWKVMRHSRDHSLAYSRKRWMDESERGKERGRQTETGVFSFLELKGKNHFKSLVHSPRATSVISQEKETKTPLDF